MESSGSTELFPFKLNSMNLAVLLVITNFLRTLFIIFVIWYGIKLLVKYVFPLMLRHTMKNVQSRMEEQIRQQQRGARREGEVTVEGSPKTGPQKSNEGEYVDFEEVK
jgi:flagellar biosynthesis/type III secretory pathway M-ring protein FliF/YscJ